MNHLQTLVAAVSLVVPLSSAHAQLTRGFVSGIVRDAGGAAVEGAAVEIANLATGLVRRTHTNAAGVYRLAGVEPGAYSAEYARPGFQSRRISHLTVATAREVVLNQVLRIASATSATEDAEAPPGAELAKSAATLDRTLGRLAVRTLPVFSAGGTDRDVTRLALLAPAVTRAPGSAQMAANGQRARNNNFTIDGVDNNDLSVT
ncbi:MAG: carboxypeptidase regulatory-like domain-containing protein, partial [Acidobacteria bacterium]|nr:carboxypeptidase regulatory-like domain-containing protein [Acidobacteriota bacterium]